MNVKKALIASLTFSLLYALTIVLQQFFLKSSIDPLNLNFFTYLFSASILTTYTLLFKKETFKFKSRKGLVLAIVSGIIGSVVADLAVVYGLKVSSSINWGIISRLSILVTFFLAVFMVNEKVNLTKIIAVIISLIGVLLVVYKPGSKVILNTGDLLFLIALFCFSYSNILSQQALEYITVLQLTYIRFATTAIVLGILFFAFSHFEKVTIWGFIIFNGLSFIVGITLVNIIIKKAGATFFAIASNMVPIFIAVLSIFILKEAPTLTQIIGGIAIISSIFLFEKLRITKIR